MRPFPVVRGLIVAGTGLLLVTLTPSTAAACDASYGTKPTVSFGGDSLFGGTCSTGTSLTGAIVVALLAVAVLVFLARLAFQKGEVAAVSWAAASTSAPTAGSDLTPSSTPTGPETSAADRALAEYLTSVGLRDGMAPPQPASPQPTPPQPTLPPDNPQ
jgi:hypothetical protein